VANPSHSKNGDLEGKVEMSRVRIRNTSTSNIGFSFGFLFRGQQSLVEESRLSEGDKRMIAAKKLVVEPEKMPMPEPVKEEVKSNVPENKGAPEGINEIPPAPVKPPIPSAVPTTPVAPVVEPGPVAPAAAPAVESATPAKPKHTEAQLKELSKKELKELSKGLGADGRSRGSMIAKILESQEK